MFVSCVMRLRHKNLDLSLVVKILSGIAFFKDKIVTINQKETGRGNAFKIFVINTGK